VLTARFVVDMGDNPVIGFRNHIILVALEYGGTWDEEVTWIEPVTRCADTNLSVELRSEIPLTTSQPLTRRAVLEPA
jgi:hypothetical protein